MFEEGRGCWSGGLIFPLIVGVHYRKCSLKAALIYHLQPRHHFHRDSLFPERCINNHNINNIEGMLRAGVVFLARKLSSHS